MAYFPTQSTSSSKNNSGRSSASTPSKSSTPKSAPAASSGKTAAQQAAENRARALSGQKTSAAGKYTAVSKTSTDARVQASQQRKTISAGGSQTQRAPTSTVSAQKPGQPTSQRQDTGTSLIKSWTEPKKTNVSVMPGTNPNLPQGGYVVEDKKGTIKYLEATEQNREVAQKRAEQLAVPQGTKEKVGYYYRKSEERSQILKQRVEAVAPGSTQLPSRERIIKTAVLGGGYAIPSAVLTGVQTGSRAYSVATNKPYREALFNEPQYYNIFSTAQRESRESMTFGQGIVSDWLPIAAPAINKKAFDESVSRQLQERGYTPGTANYETLRRGLFGERLASGFGQTAAIISTGAISETVGLFSVGIGAKALKGTSVPVKQSVTPLFKLGFKRIAPAGAYEGATIASLQQESNFDTRSFGIPKYEIITPTEKREAITSKIEQNRIGANEWFDIQSKRADVDQAKLSEMRAEYNKKLDDAQNKSLRDFRTAVPSIRDVKNTKTGDILESALFATLSAGTTGGLIFGTSVRFPKVSKALETGAYISDTGEYPGDVLSELALRGTAKITKSPTPTPNIYLTGLPKKVDVPTINFGFDVGGKPPVLEKPGKAPTISFGVPTVSKKPGVMGNAPTFTGTGVPPLGVPDYTLTITKQKAGEVPVISESISSNVRTNVNIPTQNVNVGVISPNVISPTNVPVISSVKPSTNIPINIRQPIPIETPVNMPINIPPEVPTNVPVSIPVNIPVLTPIIGAPLPILPQGGGWGQGYGAGTGGKRLKYVSELAYGQALLSDLTFPMAGAALPLPMGYKRKKKKITKAKKANYASAGRITLPKRFLG